MKMGSALLVAIMMIAPATAQVASWDDDAGDQAVWYQATYDGSTSVDIPNDSGWYPYFDILRSGIYDETEESLVFEMVVASKEPQGTEPDLPYYTTYLTHFTYHDEPMRIVLFWYPTFDEAYTWVERLEGDYWQTLTYAEASNHPDQEGWIIELDKWNLRDQKLIPAREGDTLSDIWSTAGRSQFDWSGGHIPNPVFSGFTIINFCGIETFVMDGDYDSSRLDPGCGVKARDFAGTADAALGTYTLTKSPEGLGHIILQVERPVRASNGLATTYVYELKLFNLDDEADSVNLAAVDVPSGWDVYLPPRIDLEPGEIKDIRMAVGVPFGHKHGEFSGMSIQAKSQRDSDTTADTQIGVFWPLIAQPSGHHPSLYFHADGYWGWMNTVQEDPDADDSGIVPANGQSNSLISGGDDYVHVQETSYRWYSYLRPGLFTGLDFEVDKPIEGNLALAIAKTRDMDVTAQLWLYRQDGDDLLIAEQTEEQISFVAGQAVDIPVSMEVNPEADRIPYTDDSTLYFRMELQGPVDDPDEAADPSNNAFGFFGEFNPLIDMQYEAELYSATSFLDLPLLDYHDDVDPGLLDTLTRLQLEAPEEVSRPANPGKTIAFYFEVLNKGDEDDTVEWHIEGPKADWAEVVPGSSRVDGQGRATVAIRVDVPGDEPQDSVADLLLVGQSRSNPDAQVFGRFQTYVETNADIPDESDRFIELMDTASETEAQEAPMPVFLGLAAIAVAGFLRRRE